jgi:hypothetical protein
MGRPKSNASVNKSEEVRKLLTANPTMPVKEVVSTLAAQGIRLRDSSLACYTLGCTSLKNSQMASVAFSLLLLGPAMLSGSTSSAPGQ